MDMIDIMKSAAELKASDIHIFIGKPPMVRVNGAITELANYPVITAEESKKMIYGILYEDQVQRFEEDMELDASFDIPGVSRFRVNVLVQKNGVEAVLRIISSNIPDPKTLGLTNPIIELTKLTKGLVLVTGPTGSGKSTTLACLLDIINQTRPEHILTVEDPIEYVFKSSKCIVRQRELGTNTNSFQQALKHALRQDPDIIFIGEMRDLETISLAISAAETGHLVFGTLHTQDAPQTVDRMVDVFPSHQQELIRSQLSSTLKAVICQVLLPRKEGGGRIAAREIMIVTPAIASLIREGKTHMIYSAIETGGKFGMITMDSALADLMKRGVVTPNAALSRAQNKDHVKMKAGIPPSTPPRP
jgi:twitching motility protein PilT